MTVFQLARPIVAVLVVSSLGAVLGCDSGGGKPQSIATQDQVNNIVEMRKFYDKVAGDWNSLSAEDKSQYNKLAGGESKGQSLWKSMGNPMGARTGG